MSTTMAAAIDGVLAFFLAARASPAGVRTGGNNQRERKQRAA